jgi:hypothetical protein
LLFGFRDLIAGNGFVASVNLSGRALLVDEEDGFWMYGVNPGGVAAGGGTAGEAQAEFRSSYRSVLFDIAAEAKDYAEFEREVARFVDATNKPTATEWDEAVSEVRQGRVDADWLPKKKAEARIGVQVVLLEHPVPSANLLDEAELAA